MRRLALALWPHLVVLSLLLLVVLVGVIGDVGVIGLWIGTWVAHATDLPGLVLSLFIAFIPALAWRVAALAALSAVTQATVMSLHAELGRPIPFFSEPLIHHFIAFGVLITLFHAAINAWIIAVPRSESRRSTGTTHTRSRGSSLFERHRRH